MKKTKPTTIIVALIFIVNSAQAQTCLSEQQLPPTAPDSRYIDNGNGTVSDLETGLMWQKCPIGLTLEPVCEENSAISLRWNEALSVAGNSTYAGYNDWRLPNIKELQSTVEERCHGPAINIRHFPYTTTIYYWSSTPSVIYDSEAYVLHYGRGTIDVLFRTESGGLSPHTRLVRTQ